MTVLSVLATIFGIIGGFANIPQVIKIFKRKSAKDISITSYALIFAGTLVWVLYGIEIKNLPLMIANGLGCISCSLVIIGWFLYGRKDAHPSAYLEKDTKEKQNKGR
jgi:MtN3 and saliva related transmembrane protein